MAVIILKKLFRQFFSYDFTIVTGDGNTNYIVLFIVSRPSTQIQLSISGLLIAMRKPIRNAYLGIVKHDWTSFVAREPIGNLFYLHAAIFEIRK